MTVARVVTVLLTLSMPFVMSCGGSRPGPLTPSPPELLAGRWTGEIVDRIHGRGAVSVEASANPVGVTGTWRVAFDSGLQHSGTMSGTRLGARISWFLNPLTPIVCDYATLSGIWAVSAELQSGNRLRGEYVRFVCHGTEGGAIDLTKVE
jgi:hypothetical protein